MNVYSVAFASFTFLVLPGPTNILLAFSEAGLRWHHYVTRIATVLLAYMIVIIPVLSIFGPFLQEHAFIAKNAKLLCAIWVLYLGWRLWVFKPTEGKPFVTNGRILVATLLNPKALVIGLTLPGYSEMLTTPGVIAMIAAVISATSSIWLLGGRIVMGQSKYRMKISRKIGSAILWVFSALLTTSALY